MADVAFVPQRLVFERGLGVPAQEPGEAGDPLGQDRIALVRHRRRALLAGAERLLDLADLGVLQVPDLGGEALERPAEHGDRGEQRRVPVALDDLGADRVRVEPERGEDLGFEIRRKVAVRPDRARDLAGGHVVDRAGQPAPAAIELERPAGDLQAERGGLGVDRMGAAHHDRHRLRPGARHEHGQQLVAVVEQALPRGPQLERKRRVHDVTARQAEVEEAALGPDRLGDLRHERDHVVVGLALDLGDPLEVDPRACFDRDEGVGRDLAASDLRTDDRQLDLEHPLEAGGLGPDRGHLGQRVARDHRALPTAAGSTRSAPMSWRRCMPGHEMASAARSAAFRAASTSGPRPTTVSTRPPAVCQAPSLVATRAGVEHERVRRSGRVQAFDLVALAGRLRVSGRRQHHPHGCVTRDRQSPVGSHRRCSRAAKAASRRREQERPERGGEPRQEHLRLGVAEPCVALEEHRTGPGEHQARVERAHERGPATRQLGEDRAVDRRNELGDGLVGQVGKRAVRAHAAGVRAAVTVGEPLVVAGKRQREGVAAVAQRDQRRFLALEPLLHHHADADRALPWPVVVGKERVERLVRLPGVRADRHALPRRKAVGLDHDAVAACRELVRVRARGRERFERPAFGDPDAGRTGDLPAERLARFDPGGRRRRSERRHTGREQCVRDPCRQRRLGADHRKLDRLAPRQLDQRHTVERIDPLDDPNARLRRDPGAARRDDHLVDTRFGGELPGERVLAPAAADDEDPGRHDQATAHATIPGRLRIGRQARSIVWVRSGPTDTSTIGTRAYSSIAVT